jgi:hypothetical protein
VECQKNPPIVRIRLGNEWKFVMVRLFLEAILGDALSNDVICGRVQNRNGSLRLCRACHIPQGISHDPFHRCKFFVQRHIERIIVAALGPESDPSFPTYGNVWEAFVTEKIRQTGEVRPRHVNSLRNKYDLALRRRKEICSQILHTVLGSHVVDNAFFRTSFGNNPRGIFGATPTDPMHAVEEGMAPMILEVLIDPLPDSAKQKLDEIVESLFSKSSNRSSQRSEYPRISFSGGYSSLTQLSADEKMGKLFALAIVAETPVGREILLQRCDPDFDQKRKERAHRFKKKVNDIPETEPSDDEMDTDDEQEPKDVQLDGTEYEDDEVDPIPVSRQNLVYNPQNDAHNCLVDTQLRLHGLKYFIPMIMQMTELHATKARSIVWNITRSLLKNQNQLSGQISLPNSDDQDVPLEWRHCADRRTVLDSSITSHPEAQFYARNPVEGNTPDNGHAELETPPFSVTCENVDDLIEIIQLFLAFHAFYKYGAPLFGMNGLETIDAKVRQMMEKIRTRLVRGDGKLGWCISKFHDILHMSMDMQLFGCSENSDTSKGEHGLKLWAKLPSRTAQTSHGASAFIAQLSSRLYEQTLVNKAHSVLVPRKLIKPKARSVLEMPTFALSRKKKQSWRVDSSLKPHKKQNIELGQGIVDWFVGKHNKVVKRSGVIVYAQLYLEEYGQQTFRATPNYMGTGPWYDWVLVVYLDSNDRRLHYPFKILGFVEKDDKSGPICFGQMCSTQTETERRASKGGLFEHWHLEHKSNQEVDRPTIPIYRFVEVETILDPCLAFQLSPISVDSNDRNPQLSNHVVLVKDRHKEWPQIFIDGIEKPEKRRRAGTSRKKKRR